MRLSLRAKLTTVILALAALITVAITIGSYVQMRNQLINTAIRNEVVGTAAGTSALIKEWITTRKAIVTAGEQGRGFAVVADEVRKLAERTSRATEQITGMIEGVGEETRKAVDNMQNTLDTVRGGADHSTEAAEKITAIRQSMNDVVAKIEEIALSTKEQLSATTSMAQAAEKITNQTHHSDTALQRAAEEVRKLNDLAVSLRGLFSNFRL